MLDPVQDFRDDGGTPAWRARQQSVWRVPYQRGLRGWWDRASKPKVFCWAFFGVIGACLAVMVLGLGIPFLFSL